MRYFLFLSWLIAISCSSTVYQTDLRFVGFTDKSKSDSITVDGGLWLNAPRINSKLGSIILLDTVKNYKELTKVDLTDYWRGVQYQKVFLSITNRKALYRASIRATKDGRHLRAVNMRGDTIGLIRHFKARSN